MRSLELIFGTTSFAVATVLAAFMGGLACGSYVMGKLAHRFERCHPLRVYAGLEVLIAVVGVLLPLAFQWLVPAYRFIWAHFQASFLGFSVIRLLLCVAVLLVPTFLMGATLPILSGYVGNGSRHGNRRIGLLYAVNTVGAVLGCLAAGLILFRFAGVQKTQWIAVALNLVAAAGAFVLARRRNETAISESAGDGAVPEQQEFDCVGPRLSRREIGLLVAIYAASGFVAMLYEVAWTRVLVLVLGSSIYAYTIMLATFLLGLALGSCLAVRLARRDSHPLLNAGLCQLAIGLTTYVSLFFVEELPFLYLRAYETFDPSATGLMTIQFVLAGALMILPTLGLGAMFPITLRGLNPSGASTARVVGWAYAWNTFGAIGGSVIAGFLLIPTIGSQQTMIAGVALNALLAAVAIYSVTVGRLVRYRLVAVACVLLFAANSLRNTPAWSPSILSTGIFRYMKDYVGLDRAGFRERARKIQGEVLFFKEGLTCTISVFRNPHNLILAVNGKPDASTPSGLDNPFAPGEPRLGDLPTQSLVGHLPLLLGPDATNVLVVGLGSGVTVGALRQHPVQSIECIELEEAVVEAEKFFQDFNNAPLSDGRVQMIVNDARNHLLVTPKKYDVIVSEPSNPWLPGPAKLFTTEFFELARSRLQPGGVMCQWIQLYEIHHSHFQAILRTYMDIFPHVHLFRVNHDAVLVGSLSPRPIVLEEIERRMTPRLKADLARLRLHSMEDVLAHYWIGGDELRAAVERGLFNTDDNLFIEFEAPLKVMRRKNEAQEYAEMLNLFLDRSTGLTANLVLPQSSDAGQFWAGLGDACLRQGQPLKARWYAAHAMKLKPNAAAARVYAEALYELGEGKQALAFLERAEREWSTATEVQRAVASIALREDQWPRARVAAERVLGADPSDERARLWLGASCLRLSDFKAGLKALEPLVYGKLNDASSAELSLQLGLLYAADAQFEPAIPWLQRHLQHDPMRRDVREKLADALYRLGRHDDAAAQWQLLGRVSSVEATARLRQAQQAVAARDLPRARQLLTEAWQLDRWNDEINLELVRVLAASGERSSAVATLKQYLSWKKDSPWALGYLSELLAEQNQFAQANLLAARYRAVTGTEWPQTR